MLEMSFELSEKYEIEEYEDDFYYKRTFESSWWQSGTPHWILHTPWQKLLSTL